MWDRLLKSHKAFSVWALALSGALPYIWPVIEAASHGALGAGAQPYASVLIAAAGIFGWTIPQKSISGTQK